MLKMEIEKDLSIHKSEMKKIQRKTPGIYFLLDCDRQPLYIGETQCLKTRIQGHLCGCTNAKEFHERIEYIEIVIEADPLKRKFLEGYLIAITEGVLNSKKLFTNSYQAKAPDFNKVRAFGTCKQEGCKMHSSSNGFCYKHGGNGLTKSYIQTKAIEDFLSGKYEPALD